MCEFVSWIEVKKEGETQFLYLTDKDVFSSYGREVLGGSKDNDFLGHGAIRTFFKLSQTEGKEHDEKDFWNAPLPKEIREKLDNFDKHWGKMFSSKVFQNDDLRYIIEYAPEEWKEKAWAQLLKQKPSNDDLSYIINYAPEEWKAKARELMNKI